MHIDMKNSIKIMAAMPSAKGSKGKYIPALDISKLLFQLFPKHV
jgi:hypothetical protein